MSEVTLHLRPRQLIIISESSILWGQGGETFMYPFSCQLAAESLMTDDLAVEARTCI